MTREELIAALEKARGPSEELDLAVATWCFENGAIGGVNYYPQLWLLRNEGFVYSIDAALTLFPTRPECITTDPVRACIDALRARA